jgi:hypothetical protein
VPRVKPPAVSAQPPAVRTVPDDAVLRLDELRLILGLPRTSIRREVRQGRLRISKRCGWYWTTGKWVKEWLASGEVAPRRPAPALTGNGDGVRRSPEDAG